MTDQHTQGTWRISSNHSMYVVPANGQGIIARAEDKSDRNVGEANARLMAAAPDLLAALRKCLAQLEIIQGAVHDERCAIIDAHAAINKATAA